MAHLNGTPDLETGIHDIDGRHRRPVESIDQRGCFFRLSGRDE